MCSEVAILVSNVLECPCRRVYDLDITCEISIPIDLAKTVECFVRNVCDIKFVVA